MTHKLMEAICAPENIAAAVRAVRRNKGAPGVDGVTVRDLPELLATRWPAIEQALLEGRYQPQPVRRVTIPKRSEEHTSELQSRQYLVCRLLLEKKRTI